MVIGGRRIHELFPSWASGEAQNNASACTHIPLLLYLYFVNFPDEICANSSTLLHLLIIEPDDLAPNTRTPAQQRKDSVADIRSCNDCDRVSLPRSVPAH